MHKRTRTHPDTSWSLRPRYRWWYFYEVVIRARIPPARPRKGRHFREMKRRNQTMRGRSKGPRGWFSPEPSSAYSNLLNHGASEMSIVEPVPNNRNTDTHQQAKRDRYTGARSISCRAARIGRTGSKDKERSDGEHSHEGSSGGTGPCPAVSCSWHVAMHSRVRPLLPLQVPVIFWSCCDVERPNSEQLQSCFTSAGWLLPQIPCQTFEVYFFVNDVPAKKQNLLQRGPPR